MSRGRRMITFVVATLVAVYLALCGIVFALQRNLLYFPQPPPVTGTLERFGIETVQRDGATVELVHLPAPAGAPTVVHFHGNAEQLLDVLSLGRALSERGLGFASIEYPGYGRSPGAPTESSIYAAAETGLAILRERGVTPALTVLSGRSLGTGVAVELAARGEGARVILISPYTSIPDVGAKIYPWLPVRLLARDRYASREKAPRVTVPVLIIHGNRDEVVPFPMGQELATTFPNAKLIEVPGGSHNDDVEANPALLAQVAAFALGSR